MTTTVTVGVLALQGAFHEHIKLLETVVLLEKVYEFTWNFIEVRTPDELSRCDALIIPGGESTTMSLVAARSGLLEPLRDFVKFALAQHRSDISAEFVQGISKANLGYLRRIDIAIGIGKSNQTGRARSYRRFRCQGE